MAALPDFKDTFPKWRQRAMSELVPTLDAAGVDLLSRMLVYTPQHRITARAALQVRDQAALAWRKGACLNPMHSTHVSSMGIMSHTPSFALQHEYFDDIPQLLATLPRHVAYSCV